MRTPRELQQLYRDGVNITKLLREESGSQVNTAEIVETAYDLQAGSYVAAMEDPSLSLTKAQYAREIASVIQSLCQPLSILEAGVGEATTLAGVMENLSETVRAFGFDLSWSRIAFARDWLNKKGLSRAVLCTGSLFQIPFADNSVDVVYTSHSVEPNGGSEAPILKELFRVAQRYVILLEPGYEFVGEEAKRRMDLHGYCKDLRSTAESLGYKILRHAIFPVSVNPKSPLNPTSILIIEKAVDQSALDSQSPLCCPKLKTPLREMGGALYSPEALVAYPVVAGIPCLRIENGILASCYEKFFAAE